MPAQTFKRLINALAFSNVGNLSEFNALMEQQEPEDDHAKTEPAKHTTGRIGASVVFCMIPKRIPLQ